ncbi:MAG: LysE family translocator, partial [Chromatiales bacterium]|nr:LysE family translocator [Chromatiales bacterium]
MNDVLNRKMIPIESLTTFIIASILLALVPGPDNLFVLAQSALYGRKAGIFITLGLCTGLVLHTSAVVLGVAALFKTSPVAFSVLKIAGAIYLLYLAWHAFKASSMSVQKRRSKVLTGVQLYRRGIVMNVTNPKISIFFLAFLPQFVVSNSGSIAQQIFLLGAIFILITFTVFGVVALLAGSLGTWLNHS